MQCPSCELPLEAREVEGEIIERCARCGGEYVDSESLRALLSAHMSRNPAGAADYRRPSPLSDPVRYRNCPACGEMMVRKNFLDRSGVVVDVCAVDGVWFDRGELTTILEFAATGAMAKAERDVEKRSEWPIDALEDIAGIIPGLDRDDD